MWVQRTEGDGGQKAGEGGELTRWGCHKRGLGKALAAGQGEAGPALHVYFWKSRAGLRTPTVTLDLALGIRCFSPELISGLLPRELQNTHSFPEDTHFSPSEKPQRSRDVMDSGILPPIPLGPFIPQAQSPLLPWLTPSNLILSS